MPFPTFNNFMDKRKPRKSDTIITAADELALAKSAACAWYEHGSRSDRRSIREVDFWRSKMEPTPSRYKLEALRNKQNDEDRISSSYKNSLLDNYEIEWISKQLSHYIESSRAKDHGGGDRPAAAASNKVFLKRKIAKGFWLRHAAVCGSSRNDVVENQRCRQRLPVLEEGCVAVVGDVGCRPRPRAIRA